MRWPRERVRWWVLAWFCLGRLRVQPRTALAPVLHSILLEFHWEPAGLTSRQPQWCSRARPALSQRLPLTLPTGAGLPGATPGSRPAVVAGTPAWN